MKTELLNRYLNHLRVDKRKSINTISTYKNDINCFYKYICQRDSNLTNENEIIKKINRFIVEDFRDYMINEQKLKISTISKRLNVIALFLDYLVDGCVLEKNPVNDFRAINYKDIDKEEANELGYKLPSHHDVMTTNEFDSIMRATHERKKGEKAFEFNSSMNRLILSLARDCGLRIDNMLSIELSDLTYNKDGILILTSKKTKNKKKVRVPIVGKTLKYYLSYLECRNQLNTKSNLLFLSHRSCKKLGKDTMNLRIKALCKKANVDKNITLHCYRGFFSTQSDLVGNPRTITKLLGGWTLEGVHGVYTQDSENLDNDKIKLIKNIQQVTEY